MNATSKPISPVSSAIGPVYHVAAMQGMTKAKEPTPAVIAAIPLGSFLGFFQILRSYVEESLLRKNICSMMTIAANEEGLAVNVRDSQQHWKEGWLLTNMKLFPGSSPVIRRSHWQQ